MCVRVSLRVMCAYEDRGTSLEAMKNKEQQGRRYSRLDFRHKHCVSTSRLSQRYRYCPTLHAYSGQFNSFFASVSGPFVLYST